MAKRKHFTMDESQDDMPITNAFGEDAIVNETPPDIEEFLSETGLEGKEYRCTIKQYPPDERGAPTFMPGNWKGTYPSIAEIGAKFGPGKYLYFFTWRVPNPNGEGTKGACRQIEVSLGQEWQESHDEYLYQYSIRRQKQLITLRHRKEQNDILHGTKEEIHKQGGLDDLLDAKNKLSALGVPMGSMQPQNGLTTGGGDNMLTLILGMQQKSTELMMTLMGSQQNSMMQLFGMMMQSNSNKNSGSVYQDAVKEAMSMIRETIDLKQALNPEKAGMVDRIFDFMQGVAPEITRILAQPRAQAKNDPMVGIAKAQPDMRAVLQDQAATDLLAQKLDSTYGIAQANEILDVMGASRSDGLKEHLRKAGYDPDPKGAKPTPPAPQNMSIEEAEFSDSSEEMSEME